MSAETVINQVNELFERALVSSTQKEFLRGSLKSLSLNRSISCQEIVIKFHSAVLCQSMLVLAAFMRDLSEEELLNVEDMVNVAKELLDSEYGKPEEIDISAISDQSELSSEPDDNSDSSLLSAHSLRGHSFFSSPNSSFMQSIPPELGTLEASMRLERFKKAPIFSFTDSELIKMLSKLKTESKFIKDQLEYNSRLSENEREVTELFDSLIERRIDEKGAIKLYHCLIHDPCIRELIWILSQESQIKDYAELMHISVEKLNKLLVECKNIIIQSANLEPAENFRMQAITDAKNYLQESVHLLPAYEVGFDKVQSLWDINNQIYKNELVKESATKLSLLRLNKQRLEEQIAELENQVSPLNEEDGYYVSLGIVSAKALFADNGQLTIREFLEKAAELGRTEFSQVNLEESIERLEEYKEQDENTVINNYKFKAIIYAAHKASGLSQKEFDFIQALREGLYDSLRVEDVAQTISVDKVIERIAKDTQGKALLDVYSLNYRLRGLLEPKLEEIRDQILGYPDRSSAVLLAVKNELLQQLNEAEKENFLSIYEEVINRNGTIEQKREKSISLEEKNTLLSLNPRTGSDNKTSKKAEEAISAIAHTNTAPVEIKIPSYINLYPATDKYTYQWEKLFEQREKVGFLSERDLNHLIGTSGILHRSIVDHDFYIRRLDEHKFIATIPGEE